MSVNQVLGEAEQIEFPELRIGPVLARIDTGAKTSAIWASHVKETKKGLKVVLFDKGYEHYSGKKVLYPLFSETVVMSSNGKSERRYKIKLQVAIGDRKIRAWFTLANRSKQTFPVLIGRNVLYDRFIVDVSRGAEVVERAEELRGGDELSDEEQEQV